MYRITVRIYDVGFNQIMTRVFDMNLLEGSTASAAESIFASVAKGTYVCISGGKKC